MLALTPFGAPPATAAAAPIGTAVALSPQAALSQATSSGQPVVVSSETSPTQLVTAEPGGVFSETISAQPVRREVDGAWKDLDSSLSLGADGLVHPGLVEGDLSVSDGGPAGSMIASYTTGSYSYEVDSPFSLPAPSISGDTADFADVLPGVDLVVRAVSTGFSYDWVVTTADAASDPQLSSLMLPVHTSGLTPTKTEGGVSYRDARGFPAFWSPAPLMWDSSGDQNSASSPSSSPAPAIASSPVSSASTATSRVGASVAAAPNRSLEQSRSLAAASSPDEDASSDDPTSGPTAPETTSVDAGPADNRVAPVGQAVTASSVTLTPSSAMLTDPATVFPVVIDPNITGGTERTKDKSGWTAVWNIYPTTSLWETAHSLGAGYEGYEQDKVVRSYFTFPTGAFAGEHIIDATMNIDQIWDASCTARPTDVYRTGAITTHTTWDNQPVRYGLQDTNSFTTGCGGGTGMVSWDVKPGVTAVAADADSTATFMIRAQDETDEIAWKQFDETNANLTVDYVNPPQQPANSSRSMKTNNIAYPCGTASSPTIIDATSLTIGGTVAVTDTKNRDDDSSDAMLTGVFTVWTGSTSRTLTPDAASPGPHKVSYALSVTNGTTYHWTLATRSEWSYGSESGSFDSDATDPCYFKIDTTAPQAPQVVASETDFTGCATLDDPTTCAPNGAVGTSGTVTIDTTSTNVTSYEWTLSSSASGLPGSVDDTTLAHTVSTTSGAPVSFQITPRDQFDTLTLMAVTAAGKDSVSYWQFEVNPAVPDDSWGFDTGTGANSGADSSTSSTLALGANTTTGTARLGAAALTMNGSAPATSNDATVVTDAGFSVSLWVRVDPDVSGTLLAAPSANGDSFEIAYDAPTHTWQAGRHGSGTVNGISAPAAPYGWTQLGATYNLSANQLTFFVNGQSVGSKVYTVAPWANTGWWVGCSDMTGSATDCAQGEADDVELYSFVLAPDHDMLLANPMDASDNQPEVASEGRWCMNDAAASATASEDIFGQDLTLSASDPADTPAFVSDDAGDGTQIRALSFDGTADQSAQAAHQVEDTSGSFTLNTSVLLPATDTGNTTEVVAQQDSTSGASWTLFYRPSGDADGTGQWVFQVIDGGVTTEASTAMGAYNDGVFDTVQASYDAPEGVIELFYNGWDTGTDDHTSPTAITEPSVGTGPISVGNGTVGGTAAPLGGQIDYLDIDSGAVTLAGLNDYTSGCAA